MAEQLLLDMLVAMVVTVVKPGLAEVTGLVDILVVEHCYLLQLVGMTELAGKSVPVESTELVVLIDKPLLAESIGMIELVEVLDKLEKGIDMIELVVMELDRN